jgi:hypothetical protein
MRKLVPLILCVSLAAVCFLLWFGRSSEPKSTQSGSAAVATNEGQPDEAVQVPAQTSSTKTRTDASTTLPVTDSVATNVFMQRALAEWQAPIDFYGRVLDESSNAVAGAQVQFSWMETPSEDGERKDTTESDSAGLFSLNGKRGASLQVLVNKEGYYASRQGSDIFHYAVMGTFTPDAQNPVVFFLRKRGQGQPLLHVGGIGLHKMRDYLLDPNGKPTEVSLRDGRAVIEGQGDIKVELHNGKAIENLPSRITWQCKVTVLGGGLIQTQEEFPFLAPEAGYNNSDDWSIDATNWTEQVEKVYYVKLRDGIYGRATVRVIATSRKAFFRMESFVNPSGSPNLEPAANGP